MQYVGRAVAREMMARDSLLRSGCWRRPPPGVSTLTATKRSSCPATGTGSKGGNAT